MIRGLRMVDGRRDMTNVRERLMKSRISGIFFFFPLSVSFLLYTHNLTCMEKGE